MRIRSIKPEFWRSDDIAALDWFDRLLFIGLWSYVDDNGVGRYHLIDICADLFAPDLARDSQETLKRVSEGLRRLCDSDMIQVYEADGQKFVFVTNWEKHQRVNHPNTPRYPRPSNDSQPLLFDSPESLLRVTETLKTGTGEQGNRGTGEQGNNIPAKQVSRSRSKLPDDWVPKRSHYELAAKMESEGKSSVDVDDLAAQFRDTIAATGNKYKYKDFDRAFSTWIRRHADEPRRGRPFTGYLTKTQKAQAEWDEDRRIHDQLAAEERMTQHAVEN
ncbi:hypothetical protein [Bifidobacterium mongoliense]|uniref:Replisome organizer n=1 Tax=Bifidobacterium mongoliense TaxID=518643 RepID=A0A423UE45_9BIFI|nr:hypothetical protein [Bifidobacterium mongoliense]ROT86959.1 hypothetical protein BMONG18_0958 [Bifidobacterium mongoliense]